MRKPAFLGILAVVALSVAAYADDWSKTYDLTGKPDLRVEAAEGSVKIEPWDQNKIEARVTTRGWHIGTGAVEINDHQNGNAVEIEVRMHSHMHFSIGFDDRRIEVEIHMPKQAKVDIGTHDGRITARGLQGELAFSSGDGRLELSDLDGSLRAHTSDGAVQASGRFDGLDVKTGDGHVELEVRRGSRLQQDWEVRTSDGGVRVSLPEDLAANLSLHTGDGHITTNFPVTVQGSFDHSNLRGTINGGGKELTVHTGDGSITLDKS